MKKLEIHLLLLLVFLPYFSGAATFNDSKIGFSISIPDGWETVLIDSSHRYFKDATGKHKANIGVARYKIGSDYDNARDWCNETSYAYYLFVESNPIYGYVYTRESTIHDGLYAVYCNAGWGDTVVSEHVRYVGINDRGYELYVTTDTSDMQTYYSEYIDIVESIHIYRDDEFNKTGTSGLKRFSKPQEVSVIPNSFLNNPGISAYGDIRRLEIYNPLGQLIWASHGNSNTVFNGISADFRNMSSGIYYIRYQKKNGNLWKNVKTICIR